MKNRSLTALAFVLIMLGSHNVLLNAAVAVDVPTVGLGVDFDAQQAALLENFKDSSSDMKGLLSAALQSDGLAGARYEEFDAVLSGLDYVFSKELRFSIPKTQYAVVASWGFGGSGEHNLELMLPLPAVSFKLEVNEDTDVLPLNREGGMAAGFAKILVENELNKLAQATEGDLGSMLQGFGIPVILKPRAVFLIKLALLIQHTIKHQDINFFRNELGFLLCRLVISGDIMTPGAKDASLTSLLPKSVIDLVNKQAPALLPLVENMFATTKKLFSGMHSDVALAGKKTFVYVFNNNKIAADHLMAHASTMLDARDAEDSLESFLEQARLQVLDWDDFHAIQKKGKDLPAHASFNFMVGKLVVYGDDVSELLEIGLLSRDEAASLKQGSAVRSFVKGQFTTVLCSTNKAFFDIAQTFSAVAALVAKSWGQYMTVVRSEVAQGHDLDHCELLLSDPRERQELRRFFKSPEGLRLQERLEKAVQMARNPYDKARLKRDQKLDALDACELTLVTLETTLAQSIAAREKLVAAGKRSMATVIADLDQKITVLENDIAANKATITALNNDLDVLDAQIDGNDENVKRVELDKMLKFLKDQYALGRAVDGDMRQQVKEMQQELEKETQDAADVQAHATLSPQEKLDLREAVLLAYQQEQAQVAKDLAALNEDASLDLPLIERIAQLSVYKKLLDARVDRMKKQQQGLSRLLAFRDADARGVHLQDAQQAEFYNLERELGFVFSADDLPTICRVTKPILSLAARFINEIAQPAKGSVFEAMHNGFVKDLAAVIARSSVALENEVLVRYLLGMFFPAAQRHVVEEIFVQAAGAR